MSTIIGLKDLREHTQKYMTQVAKGKSFVVVRRSKPVFKVVPVDEWGDEGTWKTVVDFRKIDPKGVPIEDVIASLRRLNAQDRQISRQARHRTSAKSA
jgi:prevent-host-death family protein